MKRQKKLRKSSCDVQTLEKALSLKDRLFSVLALRRGARRLKKYFLIALILLPILAVALAGIRYAFLKAYHMELEKISYKSTHDIIDKESILQMLELHGSVNMATLSVKGIEKKLEANPCIDSATVHAEFPETLHIEVTERIPIVFVEMESGIDTGIRPRLFMDPKGKLFPINEKYHERFMNAPTWYVTPEDIPELKPGASIPENRCRPIRELIAAVNRYRIDEIPPIREIFRPKAWEMMLTLENGTSVTMWVDGGMKEQMERLAMLLEHSRAVGKRIIHANVIPKINPTVIYGE